MSKHTNTINDPCKTSGLSPPDGEAGNGGSKKSQAEIHADEEFKVACKVMAEARRRRDTLKKRREERELKERLEALSAENDRLRERIDDYQEAESDLLDELRQLKDELEEARADTDKILEDQKDLAWRANRVLAERDSLLRALRTRLEIIENAVSDLPPEDPDEGAA